MKRFVQTQSRKDFNVIIACPGFKPADIKIESVAIPGEEAQLIVVLNPGAAHGALGCNEKEIPFGVPEKFDTTNVNYTYQNGLLSITLGLKDGIVKETIVAEAKAK